MLIRFMIPLIVLIIGIVSFKVSSNQGLPGPIGPRGNPGNPGVNMDLVPSALISFPETILKAFQKKIIRLDQSAGDHIISYNNALMAIYDWKYLIKINLTTLELLSNITNESKTVKLLVILKEDRSKIISSTIINPKMIPQINLIFTPTTSRLSIEFFIKTSSVGGKLGAGNIFVMRVHNN